MNGIGGTEILLILIAAAIVFGPKKMAEFVKGADSHTASDSAGTYRR